MWPWKHKPTIGGLEERLERLERRFLALVEEWDDAFDRIRRAENRIKEKRAKLGEPESTPERVSEEEMLPAPSMALSPSQSRLQQQIMRLRASRRDQVKPQ